MPIYLAHEADTYNFKIGRAKKPEKRIGNLNTAHPRRAIYLVAFARLPHAEKLDEDWSPANWVGLKPERVAYQDKCHQCSKPLAGLFRDQMWFWKPRPRSNPHGRRNDYPYSLCCECVPARFLSERPMSNGSRHKPPQRPSVVEERRIERATHDQLADYASKGEWFVLDTSERVSRPILLWQGWGLMVTLVNRELRVAACG